MSGVDDYQGHVQSNHEVVGQSGPVNGDHTRESNLQDARSHESSTQEGRFLRMVTDQQEMNRGRDKQ
jgi:hypothetical protein